MWPPPPIQYAVDNYMCQEDCVAIVPTYGRSPQKDRREKPIENPYFQELFAAFSACFHAFFNESTHVETFQILPHSRPIRLPNRVRIRTPSNFFYSPQYMSFATPLIIPPIPPQLNDVFSIVLAGAEAHTLSLILVQGLGTPFQDAAKLLPRRVPGT